MSEEKNVLIRIQPKNSTEDLEAILKEFEVEGEKVTGLITIPSTNHLVTDEGHLLLIFPDRLDFAVACEPDEFVILGEKSA